MKKLINKIKSWFVREDESEKLFRVVSELCSKYNHKTDYISVEVNIGSFIDGTGKFKTYNIYTPETGHIRPMSNSNTFDLCAQEFELRLKKLHHAKTKEV